MNISPVDGDFVFDLRFRIEGPLPAGLWLQLTGPGRDADCVQVFLNVFPSNASYSIEKGRLRDNFYVIREETVAETQPVASSASSSWSQGAKLTFKRERGTMQFFINDAFVREFAVPVFPLARLGISASAGAGSSKIVLTSIEARRRMSTSTRGK